MSEIIRQISVFLLQIVIGYIPQSFAFLLFVYTYCRRPVDKTFLLGGLLLSAASVVVRALPIVNGICTMMVVFVLILIGAYFCKFPIVKCIVASLLTTILLLLLETLLVVIYQASMGSAAFQEVIANKLQWVLFSLPSTICLCLIVAVIYWLRVRKGAARHAEMDKESGAPAGGGAESGH